jgi:hypothetical protein
LLIQLEPIYILILSIILITGIYAVLGWSSFREQEPYLRSLHPFITSQHLYDQLILQNPDTYNLEITGAFHALCNDILGVRQAFLIPLGIFGPLVGNPISFPEDFGHAETELLQLEIQRSITSNFGFTPLLLPESSLFGRNALAISLWSERGLIGVLVLGEKVNSSLFTQEDIEIARTVGERLIDSKASNVLAHRLMELERQRLSETKVVDQQTRRTLHDDILPRLQSVMINLTSSSSFTDGAVQELSEIHHQLAEFHELPIIIEPELTRLGLIRALQVTVENEYRQYFNNLTWQVDEKVSENTAPSQYVSNVLYHAARSC